MKSHIWGIRVHKTISKDFEAQNIYPFPNGATSLLVPTLQASAIHLANLNNRLGKYGFDVFFRKVLETLEV